MVTEIGIIAGEIIALLEKTKRLLSITEVELFLDYPLDRIYMALGWLIREHYVRVVELHGVKYLFVVEKSPVSNRHEVVHLYAADAKS